MSKKLTFQTLVVCKNSIVVGMGKQGNKVTGNKGESLAAENLMMKGYEILGRNYRSKWGEIDIIAKINDTIVFVEVKTKTTDKFGEPWEMVNAWKIEQVKRMGEVWQREYGWDGRVRVDVVGVYLDSEIPRVEHWESVDL
jgi:putative endonuclease